MRNNVRGIFKLPRYFALACLFLFPVALFLLAGFFRSTAISDLIALEQEKNVTVARSFANSLWPEIAPLLSVDPISAGNEPAAEERLAIIRTAVQGQSAGLSVLKVKVYDLEGRVVFSTEPDEINEVKRDNPGFLAAYGGRPASELTRRDTFSAFEDQIEDRDVLSSYIPIYAPKADEPVLGVFELYSDVTPFITHIDTEQRVILGGSFLILASLFGLLFLIVRRAESIIEQQRERNRQDEERVRQQQEVIVMLNERARLARELHDSCGQVFAYINVQAQAIRHNLNKGKQEEANTLLEQLIEAAKEAHEEVREHISSLRLSAQDVEQDFWVILEDYLDAYHKRYGIQVHWHVAEDVRSVVRPIETTQLIRIIQESLANVRKHAQANHVDIRFSLTENQNVQVVIEDDGRGFDPDQMKQWDEQRYGLRIMRERAEEVGGQFQVFSQPGKGAKIVLELPGVSQASLPS